MKSQKGRHAHHDAQGKTQSNFTGFASHFKKSHIGPTNALGQGTALLGRLVFHRNKRSVVNSIHRRLRSAGSVDIAPRDGMGDIIAARGRRGAAPRAHHEQRACPAPMKPVRNMRKFRIDQPPNTSGGPMFHLKSLIEYGEQIHGLFADFDTGINDAVEENTESGFG